MGISLGAALLISAIIGAGAATVSAVQSRKAAKEAQQPAPVIPKTPLGTPAPAKPGTLKAPGAPKEPVRGASRLALIATSSRDIPPRPNRTTLSLYTRSYRISKRKGQTIHYVR